jgi:hypothetical protein
MPIERFRDALEVYVSNCHEGCAPNQDGRTRTGDRCVYVCMCVCICVCVCMCMYVRHCHEGCAA